VFLLLTMFTVHVAVYFKLNLGFIDSDQPYMWLGAHDYAKGLFYEPRYYGQSYSTFMEALFAVPFVWMNLPVYCAVPLATHLIFLFPFLFSSLYLFFHNKKPAALLIIALTLCLPADYDLLTSLPRGFVTGLFFTSFFVINILNPTNFRFIFLNTFFAVLGYFVNPNSVLVSAPFLFYIFLHHYKNPRYYYITFSALFLYWPLHLFFDRFYISHPDYVMSVIHYNFSLDFLWQNISSLDSRFAQLSFFFPNNCLLLLCVMLLVSIFLFRKNKKAFASFLIFIAMLLFSFCSGKTSEGSTWAYMSYSRMYLGIPIFICLFIPLFELNIRNCLLLPFCIPLLFSAYKILNLEKLVGRHYDSRNFHGVRVLPLKDALQIISFYKKVCAERNMDFMLISNRFWLNNVVCYGGPAIYDDYQDTQETKFDKRYWMRAKTNKKIYETFILVSSLGQFKELLPKHTYFELEKLDDYGLFLVNSNTLKTEDFIKFINAYEPYD